MEPGSKYTICRLCLYKSECLIDIFEVNMRYGYVAAEVIADLLQFQVQITDVYPRVLCPRCLDKLTEFKVFKEQCKASRSTYDSLFLHHFPDVQLIPNPMGLRTVKIEPIEITDDDMSSQMSGRSENLHPEDVLSNEVSTTQVNFVSESSGDKYPMKEVSTQVSLTSFSADEKFPLDNSPNQSAKKKRDETPEQRERRLERQRNYYNQRKQTEAPEKREVRLSKMRELAMRRRENESVEQREERLAQLRMYAVRRITSESPEQREQRLKNMRTYAENRLANESLEQRQRRLGHAPFNVQKEVQRRRPYMRRSSSSLSECGPVQAEPEERVYEPQGQFQEYLSHLGLGLVEQRVNQMQGQYAYGNPRIVVPQQSAPDKYPIHFGQPMALSFHDMHHLAPEQNISGFGESSLLQEKFCGLVRTEQGTQKPRQEGPYLPDGPGKSQQVGAGQELHQAQKKVTEVKMYEIL